MKTTDRIVLCGPMGAGKSSVGRQLAARIGHAFVDIDDCVAERVGAPVHVIFATQGEAAFRRAEAEAVLDMIDLPGRRVIALGGGALQTDAIWQRCCEPDVTLVWLRATASTSLARVSTDATPRPLLQTSDPLARLEGLAEDRRTRWSTASLAVDTDGASVDAVVETIREGLHV